ncbi:MAG: hypothetical protein IT162_04575 [Bryobacterales bacterium]|nr:hypothetical protein [Bryobacterales bacterium]
MAKFKAKTKAGGGARPEPPASTRGLLPCAVVVLGVIVLFSIVFYYALAGSGIGVAPPAPPAKQNGVKQ